jgi:hypothetical protein
MSKRTKRTRQPAPVREQETWTAEHPLITPAEHQAFLDRMGISAEEDRKWRQQQRKLTAAEHAALLKKMGVPAEQDRQGHKGRAAGAPSANGTPGSPVNPFAVGGGFLSYCVAQGWLIREGKGRSATYYATAQGLKELSRFGIQV